MKKQLVDKELLDTANRIIAEQNREIATLRMKIIRMNLETAPLEKNDHWLWT